MTRRSTVVWIVSAVLVCGVGIGVAAHAATHPAASAQAFGAHSSGVPSFGAPSVSSQPFPTATASGSASAPAAPAPTASAGVPDPEPAATITPAPAPVSTPTASSSAGAVTTVTPALSYYAFKNGTLRVGGGVSGLVDSGGTCTVTLRKGAASVSKAFPAEPGPSSTDCGEMSIASSELTSGTWSLTIRYSSPRAAGTSTATEVPL